MLVYVTTHTHLLSISVILLALETKSGITFYSLGKDPMRNKALRLQSEVSHHQYQLPAQLTKVPGLVFDRSLFVKRRKRFVLKENVILGCLLK